MEFEQLSAATQFPWKHSVGTGTAPPGASVSYQVNELLFGWADTENGKPWLGQGEQRELSAGVQHPGWPVPPQAAFEMCGRSSFPERGSVCVCVHACLQV